MMLRALWLLPARIAHWPERARGRYGGLNGGKLSDHRRLKQERDIERQPTVARKPAQDRGCAQIADRIVAAVCVLTINRTVTVTSSGYTVFPCTQVISDRFDHGVGFGLRPRAALQSEHALPQQRVPAPAPSGVVQPPFGTVARRTIVQPSLKTEMAHMRQRYRSIFSKNSRAPWLNPAPACRVPRDRAPIKGSSTSAKIVAGVRLLKERKGCELVAPVIVRFYGQFD